MIQTVTAGSWSVGATVGPEGARLNVSRPLYPGRWPGRYVPGDANGRMFPSSEAAFAFALEHGYLEPYRKAYCATCRARHWWLGGRTGTALYIGPDDCQVYSRNHHGPHSRHPSRPIGPRTSRKAE